MGRGNSATLPTQPSSDIAVPCQPRTDQMPQVPLSHCPDCNYDLHGLPPAHRCPECGFEYDEHTCVWKPAKPWYIYVGILLSGVGLLCTLPGMATQIFTRGRLGPIWTLALLFSMLGFVVYGFMFLR